MNRVYLEEDLQLIQKYFPGAKAVTLHTPFELTERERRPRLAPDTFRDTDRPTNWLKDALWTSWI